MRKVFIITAGGVVSGGPEVSHQLADAINQDGQRASMIYVPFGRQYDVPVPYRRYNAPTANLTALEDVEPNSIVVVPEIMAPAVTLWPKSDIYFWWLSLNYFAHVAKGRGREPEAEFEAIQPHVTKHLCQSNYASQFLTSRGVLNDRLGDPLRREYREALTRPPDHRNRRNLLVYNPNPMKDMDRTQKILDELGARGDAPEIVPITQMLPDEVRELLSQAKVYIDFGDHPGKDRLPRESAACGACVLVNRRGSAANDIDVPIPDEFKIDDETPGFEVAVADKILALMNSFDQQQPRFDNYRKRIAQDSAVWFDDVAALFPH